MVELSAAVRPDRHSSGNCGVRRCTEELLRNTKEMQRIVWNINALQANYSGVGTTAVRGACVALALHACQACQA